MAAIHPIGMHKLRLPPPTSAATPYEASRLSAEVSVESVQVALANVLACESFAKSPKHRCFLEYVVGEALAGRDSNLKEYTVGIEVFGRPDSFDSRDDPIVRVTASRVRAKLKAYFENEGKDAPLVIELPRGSYVPVFQPRSGPAKSPSKHHILAWSSTTWRPVSLTLGTLLSMLVVGAWVLNRRPVVGIASAVSSTGIGAVPAIAVLPFVNVGPDPGADHSARWLTAGVADVLRNVDSGLGSLVPYTGEAPGHVGAEIQNRGAEKVLQGWVWQDKEHARVTVQLIDLRSGYHIWSDVYECAPKDIFGLQQTIANGIVGALRSQHEAANHQERFLAGQAVSLEARNLYLDGLYQMQHSTKSALIRAIDYFQKSAVISPRFSQAYSHLSEAYAALVRSDFIPSSDGLAKAESAAEKALEIDRDSAHAHASMALVRSLNWQWRLAAKEFMQAIQLDPDDPTLREEYAMNCLLPTGRFNEALEELQKAQTLDPSSSSIEVSMGRFYYFSGNSDQAIDHCRKGLDLQPASREARYCLGSAFEQKAMYLQAIEILNGITDSTQDTEIISLSGHISGLGGRVREARASLSELDHLAGQRNVSSYDKALVYLGLNDTGEALRYMEKAYEERDPGLAYLAISPTWKHVRTEPRFAAIVAKISLPAV